MNFLNASSIPLPEVFGANVLSLTVSHAANISQSVPWYVNTNHPTTNVTNLSLWNITTQHTHPGWNDTITVQTWLPEAGNWNGRFQAIGRGGWAPGFNDDAFAAMAAVVSGGYATVTTDAGLIGDTVLNPSSGSLTSPGNVNWDLLQDLAVRSLYDETIIAKSIIKSVYGKSPDYSYWCGCSQGGRQGYMLAQRHTEL